MRYHNITKEDMLNGDGLRVVLWVSGCNHACEGCQNPITWDICGGLPFDQAAHDELIEALDRDFISGITFSGGDPLHPQNIADVTALAKEIKARFPHQTIWLYTGYVYEEIKDLEKNLSIKYNKNVTLNNIVDKTILGGVLVKLGNEEIDGTVKTRLSKMKKQLSQVIS